MPRRWQSQLLVGFLAKRKVDDTKGDTKLNNLINKPFYCFYMRVRLPSSPLKKVLK